MRRDVARAQRFEADVLDDIDDGLQRLYPVFGVQRIRCECIPFADYGGGGRYSIWDNNLACAAWLQDEWQKFK